MKRIILLACAWPAAVCMHGQSSFQRVTATTGGSYASSQLKVDYTVGETFIATLATSNVGASQGFHQVENVPTSIEETATTNTLALWPNPASEGVTFSGNRSLLERIDIFDALGKLVASHAQTNTFSVASLPAGVYTLRVKSAAMIEDHRLVVVH